MSDVFMSYSKEDTSTAKLISESLGTAGFSVWWDRRILPGKTWDEVISASLDSASCVVVLWSRNSVQSRYVREEADRGAGRNMLIPILIEKVEPPFGFERIQAADFSEWRGETTNSEFANVCDAINSFVKNPRTAAIRVADPGPSPVPTRAIPPPAPVLNVGFLFGRWRVVDSGNGSEMDFSPDFTFSGFTFQNILGFSNKINVYGRWSIQILGPAAFALQLWYANMTTWGGNFQVLDADHIRNLEENSIASRIR